MAEALIAKKHINAMTRKEFEGLPSRKWNERIEFNSLIILPSRRRHDSSYRCLDFVAVRDDEPVCLLSGCSDVIHVDGIGGFGKDWLKKFGAVPETVPPGGWSIDCLPTSGLLRIWPSSYRMTCGLALSSFEIYALPKETQEGD